VAGVSLQGALATQIETTQLAFSQRRSVRLLCAGSQQTARSSPVGPRRQAQLPLKGDAEQRDIGKATTGGDVRQGQFRSGQQLARDVDAGATDLFEHCAAENAAKAAIQLLACRADGFSHCPDLYVNSFYDPYLDEGCAFEELISFHGGMGGPQTEAFILHPRELRLPDEPLVGAAHVNEVLRGWRAHLQGAEVPKGSGTSGTVPEVPDPSGTAP